MSNLTQKFKKAKFVLKGGFEIPMETPKDTDSMLNCEHLQIQKLINKTLTAPIQLIRLHSLKLGLKCEKSTMDLINGLKMKYINKTKNLSNNRGGLDLLFNHLSSKRSIIYCEPVKRKYKSSNQLFKSRYGLRYPSRSSSLCKSNQKNTKKKKHIRRVRKCQIRNRYKLLLKKLFTILKTSNIDEGGLSQYIDEEEPEPIEVINEELPLESNYSEDLSIYLKSKEAIDSLIRFYLKAETEVQYRILKDLIKEFGTILQNANGIEVTVYLLELMHSKGIDIKELISSLKLEIYSNCSGYLRLIQLFDHFVNNQHITEEMYNQFNSKNCWIQLITSKFGRNLVEYFLNHSLLKSPTFHTTMFEVIEENFVYYARSNYSTFVVQTYIQSHHTKETYQNISLHFEELTQTKNGVFVIISALKAYQAEELEGLINKLVELSEKLCTNSFASTLMEYLFKNFSSARILFINTKLSHLLSKLLIYSSYYGEFLWKFYHSEATLPD